MRRFMQRISSFGVAACLAIVPLSAHAANEVDVTLRGSRASMLRQNSIAKAESYSFLRTPAQVRRYVGDGHLQQLTGNADYAVIASYPFARPAVRSFIDRLASDYRAACGEKLVVTSLTRPATKQPRNASPLSVHPAGMAVDLRVSNQPACSSWLKRELLALEARGVLDATLERSPPHFHIAVFPTPYVAYTQALAADSIAVETLRQLEAAVAERLRFGPAIVEIQPPRPNVLARIAAVVTLLVLPILA